MSDPQPYFGPRQAQSVESLMQTVDEWSLDDVIKKLLDPGDSAGAAEKAEIARVAPLFARFAATADGREMIEFLADKTVRRPHFVQGMSMEHAAMYAASRGGQDGVLFLILKMIAEGEKLAAEGGRAAILERRAAEAVAAAEAPAPKSKPKRKGAKR